MFWIVEKILMLENKSYEEIRVDELPKTDKWKYRMIFKESLNDGMSYWQIGCDGKNIELDYGIVDEENYKEKNTVNNVVIKDIRKFYRMKYREGYRPAGNSDTLLISDGPMKSNKYTSTIVKNWPVYTQAKLHGIGMLCQDQIDDKILMRSRLNNDFNKLLHMKPELKTFFEYLPKDAILDGELYNHMMSFSLLTSIIKTENIIHPRLKEIIYCIFDINYYDADGCPIEKRYELLVNAYNRYVEDNSYPKTFTIVPINIASCHDVVMKQHDEYVKLGYEGLMIKHISNGSIYGSKEYNKSLYISGRRSNILKYKSFSDEEGVITMIKNNKLVIRDIRNNIFEITCKSYIKITNDIVNKNITFRYCGLDENGIPKNPIGVCIRDYE